MAENHLITINNCSIQDRYRIQMPRVDRNMDEGEAWLVIGPNGGGKAEFVRGLAGQFEFVPNSVSSEDEATLSDRTKNGAGEAGFRDAKSVPLYSSVFTGSTAIVSLEEAAALIEEERERDESEILDHEDIGRTGRAYICEVLGGSSKKNAPLPPIASRLETLPQVKLCGIEKILDRGLRYMSTGEIRRTLLCRALLSGCKLIILSDPFAGLDVESRTILLEFFNTIVGKQLVTGTTGGSPTESGFPHIILCMERFHEIPSSINRVLEFTGKKISYCGDRSSYEKILAAKNEAAAKTRDADKKAFLDSLEKIRNESEVLTDDINSTPVPDTLIEFKNVNVGWGDHHVLVNLNWTLKPNEHWLIRGPNGSGKTTMLELITGDNMQVYREDSSLFGKRRGTGETLWDIKKQLGIVSYRLHVEYRMVGGTDLESVIISGFHDSIGLYEIASDFEKATADAWLALAGFKGREHETFSMLSYGEQRAILILRAAVKRPRVLIRDEPCHALDDNYRQKIIDLLEMVAETGTTTLLHVTHDPSEVLPCEHHVLALHPDEDPMFRIIEQ